MATIAQRIAYIAKSYIGKKELPNNSGFADPEFQKKMAAVGWLKGHAWCAYTGELIWKEAYGVQHKLYAHIDKLFSGSATATWANFKASPYFKTGQTPKVGAIVVWQHGSSWAGHVGVVVGVVAGTNKFLTVEGNTNAEGGREGIEIDDKTRLTGAPKSAKGLNVLGFIYPTE